MRALRLTLLLAAATLACGDPDPDVAPAEEMLGRLPLSLFHIDRDRFLPATDPDTLSATDSLHLLPDEEVYGIVVGDSARAYPISMIAYHHVINDTVAGRHVAVTY